MTHGGLLGFGLFGLLAVGIYVLLLVALPLSARSRFELRLADIRDQADDLYSRTPDRCFRAVAHRAELLMDSATEFTMLRALVVVRVFNDADARRIEDYMHPTVSRLSPEDRRAVHSLDAQLIDAARRYLFTGSLTGWFVGLYWFLLRLVPRPHETRKVRTVATEYAYVIETEAELPGHRGSLVSF